MLPAGDPHQRLAAQIAVKRTLELDELRQAHWRSELVDELLHRFVTEFWNPAHAPGAT